MTTLFISHASEDKVDVARPLAVELASRGYNIWFDEFSLKIGDSISRQIDKGLSLCNYGVVIISPHFLSKGWPERELQGLVTAELHYQRKVILPVWHGVTKESIFRYSPPLADKLATDTSKGIRKVADDIQAAAPLADPGLGSLDEPPRISELPRNLRIALAKELPWYPPKEPNAHENYFPHPEGAFLIRWLYYYERDEEVRAALKDAFNRLQNEHFEIASEWGAPDIEFDLDEAVKDFERVKNHKKG